MTRRRRSRRLIALTAVLTVALVAGVLFVVLRSPEGPASAAECLKRPSRTSVTGPQRREYRIESVEKNLTLDARGATFTGYPFETLYPLSLGKRGPGIHLCLIGGLVRGQQPRNLTWQQMKTRYDGAGARIAGNGWYVIDGLRVENVEDGIDPRGSDEKYPKDGDGMVLRNLYFRYIRDDCVENDDIAGGLIEDSLFDGCNTGISERPSRGNEQLQFPAPSNETLVVRNVLLRLQAMPGPRGASSKARGHGQLFKWSAVANRLSIQHSIFLVEQLPNGGDTSFPAGTVANDVTVVWLGSGQFPGRVPDGVTITTDRRVWDKARARWLGRHGCTSFTSCSRLFNPTVAP